MTERWVSGRDPPNTAEKRATTTSRPSSIERASSGTSNLRAKRPSRYESDAHLKTSEGLPVLLCDPLGGARVPNRVGTSELPCQFGSTSNRPKSGLYPTRVRLYTTRTSGRLSARGTVGILHANPGMDPTPTSVSRLTPTRRRKACRVACSQVGDEAEPPPGRVHPGLACQSDRVNLGMRWKLPPGRLAEL